MKDIFETVGHYLLRLIEHPLVKLILAAIVWVLRVLFGPFRPIYGMVLFLCTVDFITGYSYARMNPNIIPNSKRLREGIAKLGLYCALLAFGYYCGKVDSMIYLQTAFEVGISTTELYSIFENWEKIYRFKGKELPTIIKWIMGIIRGKTDFGDTPAVVKTFIQFLFGSKKEGEKDETSV